MQGVFGKRNMIKMGVGMLVLVIAAGVAAISTVLTRTGMPPNALLCQ